MGMVIGIAGCVVVGLIIWFVEVAGVKGVAVILAIPIAVLLLNKKGRAFLGKLIEKLGPLVIGALVVLYVGERNGWNRHYFVPIPFLSGPSKAELRMALNADWVGDDWKAIEVIDRWLQVKSGGSEGKDCKCREGTILYPISIKGKFISDSRIETLGFYFYKDDFGKWHSCYRGGEKGWPFSGTNTGTMWRKSS